MPSIERSVNTPLDKSPEIPPTGMVHRFRSALEYLQIKGNEMFSISKNILGEAFKKNRLVIEEGCWNRLCGAPPSAHAMIGAA